jgi:hypothetical protein
MHSKIGQQDKRAAKHTQTNTILPQSLGVEAKGAKNSGARNLNIETIFVIDEGEVFDFIYNEAFESVMEDGEL